MEIEARTDERGYALIANFNRGYASGWRMAVSESYKDALDIKLTPRRFGGKTEMLWTQGRGYDFHVGDTIHDCEEAYGNWGEALAVIQLSVQVISASSGGYVVAETIQTSAKDLEISVQQGKGSAKPQVVDGLTIKRLRLDHGVVRFRVYRPDPARTELVEAETIECSQDDFVAFLQTGVVRTAENQLLDLFASNA